ncbi:MAG: hypothetical protein K1X88_01715 [Nannocystaceae bacterium]|nr:hypothetical protein [Nannocystaceae bacterium]
MSGHTRLITVLACLLACDVAATREETRAAGDAPRAGRQLAGGEVERGGMVVAPRWVLRDAMGTAIDAVVEPTCGGGLPCVITEPGTQGTVGPPCVRVYWLGDRYVDLRYALGTGLAADCAAHRTELAEIGYFLAPDCSGEVFNVAGGGVEEATRWTRRVVHVEETGLTYFESANTQLVQLYYAWYEGACVSVEQEPFEMVEWRPLPDDLVALGGAAPYSLSWE